MLKYAGKKLLMLIPKILLISFLIYFAIDLLPGDPLTRMVPLETYEKMSEVEKEEFRELRGLNDPLVTRYISWMGDMLHGDLGYSQVTGTSVTKMVKDRLPYTIELAAGGLILSAIFGILLGFVAGCKKNTILDYGATSFSVIGNAFPDFFWGIMLLIIFALKLKILPVGGRMPVGDSSLRARLPYMILPIITMALNLMAVLTRNTRSSMVDVLHKDYVKTARSKGLSETTVKFKHGFRNALAPVMTILCLRIPMLVGGSVVIETVFNYPGLGTMAYEALTGGDLPTIMISIMLSAILSLLASTLMDIVVAMLDPRVRLS